MTATAPRAAKKPVTTTVHEIELVDDYAWLRDPQWQDVMRDPSVLTPEIRAYLEAENAWTEAKMAPTSDLQDTLFAEMKGASRKTTLPCRLPMGHMPMASSMSLAVSSRCSSARRAMAAMKPCWSMATPKPRARSTSVSAARRTRPTTSSRPSVLTTRARSSSPL
jgi:hypothetical protein